MSTLKLDIIPKVGLGEIRFGSPSEQVTEILGQAEDVENIGDGEEFNTVVLYYWEKGITVFFEGVEKSVVSCFETENPDATMYGREIFSMTERDIIALMTENGFDVAEVEHEASGEKRVSFDDAMIDFFFVDGDLVAVNWGVLVNQKGDVEDLQ